MPDYRLERDSIQWGFNHSRAPLQIFGGGYGNGKTTALVIKALQLAKDYPGSNGLLSRSTYPKLNDTLRKEFLKWCPADWIKRRPTQDDNTCYLTNGTVVNFRYIAQRGKKNEDGTTSSNLLSATYDWIGVDQIEDPEIEHKDLLDLMGRLRGQTSYRPEGDEDRTMPSSGPRFLMVTCNPSPNWFYKNVVKPFLLFKRTGQITEELLIDPDTRIPIIELFEGSTYTNAANLPKDFIRLLETSYKGQMKKRFLMGEWAAFEGLVYPEWMTDINVVPHDVLERYLIDCRENHIKLQAIEGYDFGLTKPSCYLLGFVDDWGRIIIIDGFYQSRFHYGDQPAEIYRIRSEYAHLKAKIGQEDILADPAIFKKILIAGRNSGEDTIAKIFKDDFDLYMKAAGNSILSGVAKVGGYITGKPDWPNPFDDTKIGSSLLYVSDKLDFIDTEMSNYYWQKDTRGREMDQPMENADDHSLDVIKYMLSKLPEASKIDLPPALRPKPWMFWRETEDTDSV
jgi:hypothetical protein